MNKPTNQSNSTQDTEDVVARLNDEAMRLQGRGIDRGCVDSSLAGNLALEAADLIQSLSDRIDVLEGALEFYAETFCEFGTSNEGCGKYANETCGGCKARAAFRRS